MEKSTGIKFSEASVIALVSALGYVVAHIYEFGYCDHFGVPKNLVSVSITSILVVVTQVGVAFGFLLMILNLLAMFWESMVHSSIGRAILQMTILLLGTAFILFLSRLTRGQGVLIFGGIFAFFGFFIFLFPLITNRRTQGYLRKLEGQEDIDDHTKSLFDRALSGISLTHRFLILFILLALMGASVHGPARARTQKEFLVSMAHPDFVLVRQFGDQLVLANFDKQSQKLQAKLMFLAAAPDNPHEFRKESVGPLSKADK